jgi:hypothetical protein
VAPKIGRVGYSVSRVNIANHSSYKGGPSVNRFDALQDVKPVHRRFTLNLL